MLYVNIMLGLYSVIAVLVDGSSTSKDWGNFKRFRSYSHRKDARSTPQFDETEDEVVVRVGATATLPCSIKNLGDNLVLWFRNTLQLDVTERRITESRGSRHTLIIRKVKADDFGNYSCVADNIIGKNRQYLILSGKPHSAVFRSNPNGRYADRYNITWTVGSYTPIEEYRLSYRIVSEQTQNFPHLSYMNPKSSRKENEMIYATEYATGGFRTQWKNISLTAPSAGPFNHTMSYLIQDLDVATQYEAKIYAKNRFGWSEPSETFRFQTKGAESNLDISNDIYNSEPEIRDMSLKPKNTSNQIHQNVFTISYIVCIFSMLSTGYV